MTMCKRMLGYSRDALAVCICKTTIWQFKKQFKCVIHTYVINFKYDVKNFFFLFNFSRMYVVECYNKVVCETDAKKFLDTDNSHLHFVNKL